MSLLERRDVSVGLGPVSLGPESVIGITPLFSELCYSRRTLQCKISTVGDSPRILRVLTSDCVSVDAWLWFLFARRQQRIRVFVDGGSG